MGQDKDALKKKIVSPKVSLFLCAVVGFGAGFFAGGKWFFPGAAAALLLSLANILWKSDLYQRYRQNIRNKNKDGKMGIVFFFGLSFILNIIIIALAASVARSLKGMF